MKVPPYPSPMAGLLYSVNSEVPRRKEDREAERVLTILADEDTAPSTSDLPPPARPSLS
eukprot:CAMPEP_0118897076 /NCGR_PEP_ID=MMETSP1166-20130328/4629_1 /TAXON_ID=1104430 /ORGANISM="Chrysoreinhardia sp, Strain CCMP3193" /LENGTH=58 /DNA_ID=CAMNT_0006836143 /DNA_START=220 /DNA_END=394 /DNA_ORIENTATION=+